MLAVHNPSVESKYVYSAGDRRMGAVNHSILSSGSHSTFLEQLYLDISVIHRFLSQESSSLKFLGSNLQTCILSKK